MARKGCASNDGSALALFETVGEPAASCNCAAGKLSKASCTGRGAAFSGDACAAVSPKALYCAGACASYLTQAQYALENIFSFGAQALACSRCSRAARSRSGTEAASSPQCESRRSKPGLVKRTAGSRESFSRIAESTSAPIDSGGTAIRACSSSSRGAAAKAKAMAADEPNSSMRLVKSDTKELFSRRSCCGNCCSSKIARASCSGCASSAPGEFPRGKSPGGASGA
mmetsp:Transcript_1628/g.4870  ORF Transcript_1628/g.4870 Transcript_1628/m.4870 type:complete len:228 (+) Transcript_1628:698-1381(+)